VRISQTIAFVSFWIFGLSEGLNSWIYGGWVEGLNYMLSSGLSYGLGIGLSYWWLVGLYQGVKQEHLDDQDRRQFNQGIHRSLRNGALLSLLSTGIITGIALVLSNALSIGLTTGLSFDLRYGLSEGLNDVLSVMLYYGLNDMLRIGLNIGWLSVLCGWLVVWAATGGLTILRHYLLRLLLSSKKRTFPFQAQRFLDDATARVLLRQQGGGYGFVHRRLLDYFADTALLPADAFDAAHQAPSVPQSVSDSVSGTAPSESLRNE
jgi:hypothetical protein